MPIEMLNRIRLDLSAGLFQAAFGGMVRVPKMCIDNWQLVLRRMTIA